MKDPAASPPSLTIYGASASQPTRAVWWAYLIKGLSFEVRPNAMLREPEFLRLNPRSQMPTIVDAGFSLYEMPAILSYLCEKHGGSDLCPADLESRALVDQYLHAHHSMTRLATLKLMGPHVTIAFGGPPRESMDVIMVETIGTAIDDPDTLGAGQRVMARVAGVLESGYFRSDSPFLCGTPNATIADIACYEELAQLGWANLFEFGAFRRIETWLAEMEKLPAHDAVHRYNRELGDIASVPITLERFERANIAGLEALARMDVPIRL